MIAGAQSRLRANKYRKTASAAPPKQVVTARPLQDQANAVSEPEA